MGGSLRLNTLQNAKARQNWNKRNLYNLYRLVPRSTMGRTFFQQKFAAKSETRKYHGEHLTERKWNDLFSTTIRGVMPMSAQRLGQSDGREVAEGRGSGQDGTDERLTPSRKQDRQIPWMMGLYAPIERRLDTAIFRAMFASSVRQARSFVVHGRVKVNGKKFRHPSYLLNPGDMFSIDPELVLFATGAPKSDKPDAVARRRALLENQASETADKPSDETSTSTDDSASNPAAIEGSGAAKTATAAASTSPEESTPVAVEGSGATSTTTSTATTSEGEITATTPSEPELSEEEEDTTTNKDLLEIKHPYAVPWRPRDYLSAFAFIPRYLEVNHTICHAVYLRHPVVRPGESEVPSPFPLETMQLAYNWYLRRR